MGLDKVLHASDSGSTLKRGSLFFLSNFGGLSKNYYLCIDKGYLTKWLRKTANFAHSPNRYQDPCKIFLKICLSD